MSSVLLYRSLGLQDLGEKEACSLVRCKDRFWSKLRTALICRTLLRKRSTNQWLKAQVAWRKCQSKTRDLRSKRSEDRSMWKKLLGTPGCLPRHVAGARAATHCCSGFPEVCKGHRVSCGSFGQIRRFSAYHAQEQHMLNRHVHIFGVWASPNSCPLE